VVPHDVPAVDFNLARRPRNSGESRSVQDIFAYSIQENSCGEILPDNSPRHFILDSTHIIDGEPTRTSDRSSPLLLPCYEKPPSTPSPSLAEPSSLSQTNPLTVEQFLRAHTRPRKRVKRRDYKRRPKVIIKSDLERPKETDSSFAREDDQLRSDDDDDPLVLPTKRGRKTQLASDHQPARKRRRIRKNAETNVVQLLEFQEEMLPNIATRSLHECWHPVDPRKGRPFIHPTFTTRRHHISVGPLKPAPVPPLVIHNDNSPSGSLIDPHDALPSAKVPRKKARSSTRMTLSMEPTEEHDRKLKLWKRSVGRLRHTLLILLLAIKSRNPRRNHCSSSQMSRSPLDLHPATVTFMACRYAAWTPSSGCTIHALPESLVQNESCSPSTEPPRACYYF
jgi:hypothetical protein